MRLHCFSACDWPALQNDDRDCPERLKRMTKVKNDRTSIRKNVDIIGKEEKQKVGLPVYIRCNCSHVFG